MPWYDKLLFFLNSVFATALLFSYLLPYIPPKQFALLSVLSLGVPLLIIINFSFLLYWLIKLRKQVILSLVVLLLGFNHITSIYEFTSPPDEQIDPDEEISLLSYNVKQFNRFEWDKENDIPKEISEFFKEEDPDILGMQEYYNGELTVAETFPHKYIKIKNQNAEFGLAILSKYPIINKGSVDFPDATNNNAIFADVVVNSDTLRVINVHLQSFEVKPKLDKIEQEHSKQVFLGMGQTFVRQQHQMELVKEVVENSPYEVVVLGDFNNTAYSYIYRELLSAGLKDAFKRKGNGTGKTFNFDYFPLRIDYILVEETLEVTGFETMEVKFSDHFPIKATIKP